MPAGAGPLVPAEILSAVEGELLRRIGLGASTGEASEALARSLLFKHWPDLLVGEQLDRARLFYNQYYWFVRFVTLWQRRHGQDARLEQQVARMLDNLDPKFDWNLLRELEEQARSLHS